MSNDVNDPERMRVAAKTNLFSHKDFAEYVNAAEEAATDKGYYEMLKDTNARQKFFMALTTPDSEDHSEITKVKSKIKQLIEQETELMGFKDQLSHEEISEIESDTYAEVAT